MMGQQPVQMRLHFLLFSFVHGVPYVFNQEKMEMRLPSIFLGYPCTSLVLKLVVSLPVDKLALANSIPP